MSTTPQPDGNGDLGKRVLEALRHVYTQHRRQNARRACDLERGLPMREPFFVLRRVPRFWARTDLHASHDTAITPLTRLETSSLDDLTSKIPLCTRRLLIEGDLGQGKTTLCYSFIHSWASSASSFDQSSSSSKSESHVVIYADCCRHACVQAPCHPGAMEVTCWLTQVVLDLVRDNLECDPCALCLWLRNNCNRLWVIMDNYVPRGDLPTILDDVLDLHPQQTLRVPLGKIMVVTSPGHLPKHVFDGMYFSYGLNPDYGSKVMTKQLKKAGIATEGLVQQLRDVMLSWEPFRCPLFLSSLAHFLSDQRGLEDVRSSKFRLLHSLVENSMARLRQAQQVRLDPDVTIRPLMLTLEHLAYEHLASNRNHFLKDEAISAFCRDHFCDLRFLYESHGLGGEETYFGFTSRSFRDYFAARHVCKLLQLEDRREAVLRQLATHSAYASLSRLVVGQLHFMNRHDLLQQVLACVLAATRDRYTVVEVAGGVTRGGLGDLAPALRCLREVGHLPPLVGRAALSLPSVLELSQEVSCDVIQDFLQVAASDNTATHVVVLQVCSILGNRLLCLRLAGALNAMASMTSLLVRMLYVEDTGLLVEFLCHVFGSNSHTRTLTLSGPMNSVENLSTTHHRLVKSVFTRSIALRALTLENFGYHHRVTYILRCWPKIFERLELRKCNLESAGEIVADCVRESPDFRQLKIDNCFLPSAGLRCIMSGLLACVCLQSLHLSSLSSRRHFGSADVTKETFRSSLDLDACAMLSEVLMSLTCLEEVTLLQCGVDDEKLRVLRVGVMRCHSLTTLDLTGNHVTNDSSDDIIRMLHTHTSLICFILSGNKISPEARRRIIEETANCSHLRLAM